MRVLVNGFYNHNNVGDELFVEAFKLLLPDITFTFTDTIQSNMLENIDAVFIGGGSLLDGEPMIEDISLLKTLPIFYISVGSETDIHPIHLELMAVARLIAIRSDDKFDYIKTINPNTILIPDIVYALQSESTATPAPNSILILPNISTVPQNTDPHWKYAAWEAFKFEFSQVCDTLIDNGCTVHFLAMCRDSKLHDDYAAGEIISSMHNRNYDLILPNWNILDTIRNHSAVITQRYHGMILSEIAARPYISIHHHNKLRKSHLNTGKFVSYYGIQKDKLVYEVRTLSVKEDCAVPKDMYDELVDKIRAALK